MQLLLFLIGFFSISQLGLHLWPSWSRPLGIPVDYLSPTIYFTELLLLVLLLANSKKLLLWSKQYPFLLLLPLLNLPFSFSSPFTLFNWFRLLLLLNLALIISHSSTKRLQPLISGLTLGTLLSVSLVFIQFLFRHSLGGPLYWLGERSFDLNTLNVARIDTCLLGQCLPKLRPYGTFSHPNSLAGFLLVSSLIVLNLRRLAPQFLVVLPLLLTPPALLLTFSRTALLCLGLILLFTSAGKIRLPRKFLLYLPLLTLPIFAVSLIAPSSLPQAISERLLLNRLSLQIITTYPFFGTGLGNYLLAQTQLIKEVSTNQFLVLLQPVHNAYLLLVSELGLPLSLALLLLVSRLKITRIPTFLFLALSSVLLISLLDHYWLTLPQNRLLLAILLGLVFNPHASGPKVLRTTN